jgi:NitT/TauT family transport system substrate-binding protein
VQLIRDFSLTAVAAALAIGLGSHAMAADTIKVVTAHGVWDTYPTEAGEKAGIFKKRDLSVEYIYSAGSGETLQAVIAGSADIGEVGTIGILGAYLKGAPVRIIGAEATGSAEYWYARTDSGIKTLKDTDGKTIAFSSNGSSTNSVVRAFIAENGLKATAVATGSPAATLTAVMSGQIDVGWASPPFGFKEIDEGKIRIVARGNDVKSMRDQTIRVIVTNVDALNKKKAALQRYMDGRREAVELMYSDNPQPLRDYAATNQLSEDMVRRVRDFYPKAMLQADEIKGLDQLLAEAMSLKFLPQPLTKEQVSEVIQLMPASK